MTKPIKISVITANKNKKITDKILRSQTTQRIGRLLYWSDISMNELVDLEIRLQKMYPKVNRLPIIKLPK